MCSSLWDVLKKNFTTCFDTYTHKDIHYIIYLIIHCEHLICWISVSTKRKAKRLGSGWRSWRRLYHAACTSTTLGKQTFWGILCCKLPISSCDWEISDILHFLCSPYFNCIQNVFLWSSSIWITGYFFILLVNASSFSRSTWNENWLL